MSKPLADMASAELQKAYDKASAESSKQTTLMIAADRGHERPSDIKDLTDPLSLAQKAASQRCYDVWAEMDRRKRYSGTLKKIKPHT